jgi:hypothetical protein
VAQPLLPYVGDRSDNCGSEMRIIWFIKRGLDNTEDCEALRAGQGDETGETGECERLWSFGDILRRFEAPDGV